MEKRNALLSVWDKTGIELFAKTLVQMGWNIYSSGGTAERISEANIPVIDVAKLVGGKAILGHRVVTLSREVHAALLARDCPEDLAELKNMGIPWIDLLYNNAYPLETAIKEHGYDPIKVIENTDIGGPCLLRSAAKGGRITICDPDDIEKVINWLKNGRQDENAFINFLRAKAEMFVANYCLMSARYHSNGGYDGMLFRQIQKLRYGENPQQTPAHLFTTTLMGKPDNPLAVENFVPLAGDAGFVNLTDRNNMIHTLVNIAAGWEVNFNEIPKIAVAVKHSSACGAGVADDPVSAIEKMVEGDPDSVHGAAIITNFKMDIECAKVLLFHGMKGDQRRLIEVVVVPEMDDDAIKLLRRPKDACKMFGNPGLYDIGLSNLGLGYSIMFRPIIGGALGQPPNKYLLDFNNEDLEFVCGEQLSEEQKKDLVLASAICSTTKSNTITVVRDRMLIGNSAGKKARHFATEWVTTLAKKFKHILDGAVAVSDSFFPFEDALGILISHGIKIVFSRSGARRDKKIKEYAKEQGITLLLIPVGKGRAFFGH